MKGYVYVIRSEEGPVKIGCSISPDKRIQAISSASGRFIVERFITPEIEDYAVLEQRLHAYFAKHRRPGEWFDVSFGEAVSAAKYFGLAHAPDAWKGTERYLKASALRDRLDKFIAERNPSDKEIIAFMDGFGFEALGEVEFADYCDFASVREKMIDLSVSLDQAIVQFGENKINQVLEKSGWRDSLIQIEKKFSEELEIIKSIKNGTIQ